jgi:hypothetical protein
VTRLGAFSPIGLLFTLDYRLKIKEAAQIFEYFFRGKMHSLILAQKLVMLHFGVFFTNTSGHRVPHSNSPKLLTKLVYTVVEVEKMF